MIEHSFAQANLAQVDVVQAGQHRDRQDQQAGSGWLRGFDGSSQHLAAAGGVHGQHAHAQLGRLPDGGCNGVRDVVILEIEKDAAAGTDQFADYGRTFGSVELHADLISMGGVANSRHDLPGGCGRRYIQGNDETLVRVHILGLDSRAMLSNYRC